VSSEPPIVAGFTGIKLAMAQTFTAIYERDGDWWIGYCPEIPGANGQGRNKDDCRQSLAEAIELILEYRRQDATSTPG
jgi:predicted RNase H-like HicB family nuclease